MTVCLKWLGDHGKLDSVRWWCGEIHGTAAGSSETTDVHLPSWGGLIRTRGSRQEKRFGRALHHSNENRWVCPESRSDCWRYKIGVEKTKNTYREDVCSTLWKSVSLTFTENSLIGAIWTCDTKRLNFLLPGLSLASFPKLLKSYHPKDDTWSVVHTCLDNVLFT